MILIVIEGVYSMDGDIPDLVEMVRIKKKYKCMLFLDEAHSFGTMGETGRGLCEHFNVDPKDVDARMGTMSKALGSVGGFILGSVALTKYLKHCAGGFVFSVGLSPAHCGAALKSVQLMIKSGSRTQKLQERSMYFYDLCKKANIPMGPTTFRGAPVVVVIIGSTIATAMASQYLAQKGQVNVKPIVYPAVEEGKCRLRFFISSLHTKKQLEHSVAILSEFVKDPEAAISLMTADLPTQALETAAQVTKTQPSTEKAATPVPSPAKKPVEPKQTVPSSTPTTTPSVSASPVKAIPPPVPVTSTPVTTVTTNGKPKGKHAKRKAAELLQNTANAAKANGSSNGKGPQRKN